ncbi:unnamed protein product [Chondrus crispus]|uniref:Uncharacterized protein n=1 Tax=Chondrus crispus TaxID=2769 RepID=R7Q9G4_CHOCR|nr:unnamed protein product [Chondrus crispus]CDF34699.1 unnamed protein product [Chondrus crispus]|eukprot:XP_005714518.1 unnamed protein product [Chondrus crispus]
MRLPKHHESRNRCRCVRLCALIQESCRQLNPIPGLTMGMRGMHLTPRPMQSSKIPNFESPPCYM